MATRTKAIIIILSVVLFILGIASYSTFIHWFLIKDEGIKYMVSGFSDQFNHMILFNLIIAVIPLSAFVLKLKKGKNIFISSSILLGCVLAAIIIKRFLLFKDIKTFQIVLIDKSIETQLPLSNYTPENYMLVALLAGILLLSVLKSQKTLFNEE